MVVRDNVPDAPDAAKPEPAIEYPFTPYGLEITFSKPYVAKQEAFYGRPFHELLALI